MFWAIQNAIPLDHAAKGLQPPPLQTTKLHNSFSPGLGRKGLK